MNRFCEDRPLQILFDLGVFRSNQEFNFKTYWALEQAFMCSNEILDNYRHYQQNHRPTLGGPRKKYFDLERVRIKFIKSEIDMDEMKRRTLLIHKKHDCMDAFWRTHVYFANMISSKLTDLANETKKESSVRAMKRNFYAFVKSCVDIDETQHKTRVEALRKAYVNTYVIERMVRRYIPRLEKFKKDIREIKEQLDAAVKEGAEWTRGL
jgi:hypothetical protein